MSRFLVVGAGGIGGVVAAHLTEQGHDVTTLTRNPLIADAVNAWGFRVRGEASPGTVKGRMVERLRKGDGKFDFVLLATQPPQVEEAATSVLDSLADTGAMVCFQNGLCEERIAAIAGQRNVIGAIVAWGASMVEPGIYDRTSAGGFQIGRLDGGEDERLRELARVLECVGPTVITKNLLGARWSKLAINCAISSLGTVGGNRLGVLMRQRHVRRLALEIMTEVTETARAHGVRLEKVAGTLDLDWIALTEADRASLGSPMLMAKHALLLAVGARYRRLRSSMLAAIERGRPPSVEFLNGEVITRAREKGLRTPINSAVRDEVLRIAGGKARSSHQLLRAFYETTRPLVAAGAKESARPAAQAAGQAEPQEARPPVTTVEAAPLAQALEPTVDSSRGAAVHAFASQAELAPPPEAPAPAAPDAREEPPESQADLPVLAPARPHPGAGAPLPREQTGAPRDQRPGEMSSSISTKMGVPRIESSVPVAPRDGLVVGEPVAAPEAGPGGTLLLLKAQKLVSTEDDLNGSAPSSAVQTERDARPPLEESETLIDPEKLPPQP